MFLLRHIHLLTFLLDVFGKLAGALSVVTWVWVAILYVSCHSCIFNNFFTSNSLYYNRRPQSSNPLCRSYAHFISFLILSAVWIGRVYVNLCPTNGSDPRSIAIGIMIATQMPWECEAKMLWCAAACFSSALAFCTGFSGKFTSRYILGLCPSLSHSTRSMYHHLPRRRRLGCRSCYQHCTNPHENHLCIRFWTSSRLLVRKDSPTIGSLVIKSW